MNALRSHPDPDFYACGPTRTEYLARLSDEEWRLWMAIGGVMPARIREKFKQETERDRRRLERGRR